MTHLVAIDSGGTRTNVRVVPPGGEPIEIPELDTVIDVVRSSREMEDNFKSLFDEIESHLLGSPRVGIQVPSLPEDLG
jgi:hypothetical protein